MRINKIITVFLLGLSALSFQVEGLNRNKKLPNIIIIMADDLGYGDLGCYGSTLHRTPNIDRMASEGIKFTDAYSTSGYCTPSRASLMTGCYPRRVDLHVNARPEGSAGRQVLFPIAKKGLDPTEITIADILKNQGYATACIGKWHLGDQPEFLPTRQGFDFYFGIPYSNDMGTNQGPDRPPLPLLKNESVIEAPVDQTTLTQRYTEKAINFITANNPNKTGTPFFLYLPHTFPHVPLFASDAFKGKSANGTYGDAVEEIDWSTGEILKSLDELEILDNTMLMFMSDNGAASRWGGSNEPFSGWKGSTTEGGQRVPFLILWPDKIKSATVNNAMITLMDVLPTIAELAGSQIPSDRIIDGKNISEQLFNKTNTSPYEFFAFYQKEQLQAIRSENWKLILPLDSTINSHAAGFSEGRPLKLVDLSVDIKEEADVSWQNPEIVQKLLGYAEKIRYDIGDLNISGVNQRKAGFVNNPVPLLME